MMLWNASTPASRLVAYELPLATEMSISVKSRSIGTCSSSGVFSPMGRSRSTLLSFPSSPKILIARSPLYTYGMTCIIQRPICWIVICKCSVYVNCPASAVICFAMMALPESSLESEPRAVS